MFPLRRGPVYLDVGLRMYSTRHQLPLPSFYWVSIPPRLATGIEKTPSLDGRCKYLIFEQADLQGFT